MEWSPGSLLFSLLYTWGLGLLPALIARRIAKRPLKRFQANVLAFVTCATLAGLAVVMRASAGEPSAHISPAWIFVFLAARWIMIRPGKSGSSTETTPNTQQDHLSRDEIMTKLRAMIADPATKSEHRAQAKDRLERYEKLARSSVEKMAPALPKTRRSTRRKPKIQAMARVSALALATLLVLDLLLMAFGYRLLLKGKIVHPGEHYVAAEWGDLGTYPRATLICWYWTGRNLKPAAAWYDVGRRELDECPLISHPKSDIWTGEAT